MGEAGTAEQAFGRIHALDPDVAVLDVRLPDGDGVSVCREVRCRHPRTACLMLTSFADDEALFDAIMAGAAGLRPQADPGQRPRRRRPQGRRRRVLLDPAVTARVLERLRRGPEVDERLAHAHRAGAHASST